MGPDLISRSGPAKKSACHTRFQEGTLMLMSPASAKATASKSKGRKANLISKHLKSQASSKASRASHLDAGQKLMLETCAWMRYRAPARNGLSCICNTVREYCSWERSSSPKVPAVLLALPEDRLARRMSLVEFGGTATVDTVPRVVCRPVLMTATSTPHTKVDAAITIPVSEHTIRHCSF